MLLFNNACYHLSFVLDNEKCDVPSHLHNHPIICKGGHKSCGSNLNTITLQYIVRLQSSHLTFVGVKGKECIEHVSDKEKKMEDNRGSYGASMHGFTLTILNVLIVLWALICVSDFREGGLFKPYTNQHECRKGYFWRHYHT